MIGRLVTRCITAHGDNATDKELFEWLRLGSGKYYDSNLEAEDQKIINGWLTDRPDRYKGLLRHYIERNSSKQSIQMYKFRSLIPGTAVPDDFGIWCLEQASSAEANEAIIRAYLSEVVDALRIQRGDRGLTLEKVERWAEEGKSRQEWLMPYLFCNIDDWRTEFAERDKKSKETHDIQRKERSRQIIQHMPAIKSGVANVQLMNQLAGVWWNQYIDTRGKTLQARFENFSENGSELLEAAKLGFIASFERSDLPTVDEIIDLSIKSREHYIRRPCLVGMEIRWELGVSAIDSLSDETLKRMMAFRLTYGCDQTPEWFTYLIKTRPELVAEVYIQYAAASLKARESHIDSLYALENDADFKVLAQLTVPALLKKFPLRARSAQLGCLEHLLKSALRYQMATLPLIVKEKLSKKSLEISQKVYWLAVGMLINQSQYESLLWEFVGNSQSRLNYLSGFLSARYGELTQEFELSVYTVGKLIEQLVPHAELDWSRGGGFVTSAMSRGDHVRALISRLISMVTAQAEDEIARLLKLPAMEKPKFLLEYARHQIRQKQREASFSFLSLAEVAGMLANQGPANVVDLTELVLFHLDDIADEIRHENDDGFAKFWNIEADKINAKPGYHTVKMWEQFTKPEDEGGDIHTIWVQVTNPGQTLPNRHRLFERSKKCKDKFLIVSDVYPTATTADADLILPSAMWIEREGMYGNSERRTQHFEKMVDPPGEAMSDTWQLIEVAKRMGYEKLFPWDEENHIEEI
ncbi:MAG: molybdopterin-dependent oxidoreductase, partial [Thiomicrorhabdus sp.]|nr:molybdopterin-dependent oxidoreductase [Thiomicrorhabdus sp.]